MGFFFFRLLSLKYQSPPKIPMWGCEVERSKAKQRKMLYNISNIAICVVWDVERHAVVSVFHQFAEHFQNRTHTHFHIAHTLNRQLDTAPDDGKFATMDDRCEGVRTKYIFDIAKNRPLSVVVWRCIYLWQVATTNRNTYHYTNYRILV